MVTHCGENICNGREAATAAAHERQKRNEEDDHPNLPEATAPETKPQLRWFVASDLLQDIPRFQPFQLLQYTFPVDKCTADKQDLAFYAHDSQPNVITQV